MQKLRITLIILLVSTRLGVMAQLTPTIEYFDLQDVQLLDSPFKHSGLNEALADTVVLTGDEQYLQPAHRFAYRLILDSLLQHEDLLTGMHANTYDMLRLAKMLYQTSLENKYIDYYERTLYNRTPSVHYGEMIYAHQGDDLYVNLFIPSHLDWKKKNIEVIQENNFPDEASTQFIINPKKITTFTLKLRYPAWVAEGAMQVAVNGEAIAITDKPGEYVSIKRKWKKGDKVSVELPMTIAAKSLPGESDYSAFLYGPIVLAAKTGTEDIAALLADDSNGERDIISRAQASVQELREVKDKTTKQGEKERTTLENKTIDIVTCGEQQPESDHFIQASNSRIGFIEDIRWREAAGWFSYRLKNPSHNAKLLYLTYLDIDPSRYCDIYVNWQKVGDLRTTGKNGNNVQTLIFAIPQDVSLYDMIEVNFIAHPNSITPKIVEVRLLSTSL